MIALHRGMFRTVLITALGRTAFIQRYFIVC